MFEMKNIYIPNFTFDGTFNVIIVNPKGVMHLSVKEV